MDPVDRFVGGFLGLALGDALGAPFEGGLLERFVWRLLGRTADGKMRWTDDTQMALDLAESLLARQGLDLDDLASRFAAGYRWSRGYGPGAARLLRRIRRGQDWRKANRAVFRDGSFGNGGAMRAPIVGLFFSATPDRIADRARDSARVTHAHPLGLEGAVLIAAATGHALQSQEPLAILDFAASQCRHADYTPRLAEARKWLCSQPLDAADVRRRLGNGIAAVESCVTALYLALRFLHGSFEAMHAQVLATGGDVDTIGAMAGAIWGTANGPERLPRRALDKLEDRARIVRLAEELYCAHPTS